ncbi:hypothetical protein LCGC14_1578570 [marine sediment metagenome]|uniref:Terminase large subunit gp17-like C-terminal domain-containing protein n=1 Tax=marine sediment metagenome TaxID=412755 RepID=A0A0F9KYI4_9ZZZZ
MADPKKRKGIGKLDSLFFTHIYLRHYLKFTTPQFHKEIYHALGDDVQNFVELVAFRGSAKSTIASLSYPLYRAVTGKSRFIILISDTFKQAKIHIANLISELENNKELREDYGDFRSKDEEWTATNLVLNNGVRILSLSKGQKIRGLRHLEFRPDLIIGDDIENPDSVRVKEQRDKTEEWWLSDVIPALADEGKLVLIGSLLHTDSLMARTKGRILTGGWGLLKEYPIIKDGKSLWPERYDEKGLERLQKQIAQSNEGKRFWLREYLLQIVPDEGQIVTKVNYYQKLPTIKVIGIGVDLAISQKQTADNTAFNVAGEGDDGKIYNLYNFSKRLLFNDTLSKLHEIYENYKVLYPGVPIKIGWEDVAYQAVGIEEYTRRYGVKPESIKRTQDKHARLNLLEPRLTSGQILFRETGDEDVVMQILNFGVERYDDLMDAAEISFNLLIRHVAPNVRLL